MTDCLKLRSKLCEIGKSSRAATSRDKVLSSGMSNRPSFLLPESSADRLSALLLLAFSKREYIHANFCATSKIKNKPCCALFDSCIFRCNSTPHNCFAYAQCGNQRACSTIGLSFAPQFCNDPLQ